MRAVTIREQQIVVEEHPDPQPRAGEVLVRVRAAGLNGGDMMQRRGLYPAPPGWPQDIPGMELAGEVAALGRGASAIAAGGFAEAGPFDVILELVGAPNLPDNLAALASGGRIAVIGVSAGAKAELNVLALMGKRARIHGSTLRARPFEEKALAA